MKKFKIRCSANGNIVGGTIGLTEVQKRDLAILQAKDKRTALQEKKMIDLIDKSNNTELPEGPKTYCKDWLKGQLLDYQKEFSSKYTDKGNIMEDESIDFIAEQLGFGLLIKNEDHFSDEFMQGTPDVLLKDLVIDVKNSWSAETFPMFEDKIPDLNYYWQLQGYMYLTGKSKAKLIYTLMDTPKHLIEREARYDSFRQGYEDLEMSIYKKFEKNITYSNIDPKLRIKVFEVERNESDIEKIIERVKECRKYIDSLNKKLCTKQ